MSSVLSSFGQFRSPEEDAADALSSMNFSPSREEEDTDEVTVTKAILSKANITYMRFNLIPPTIPTHQMSLLSEEDDNMFSRRTETPSQQDSEKEEEDEQDDVTISEEEDEMTEAPEVVNSIPIHTTDPLIQFDTLNRALKNNHTALRYLVTNTLEPVDPKRMITPYNSTKWRFTVPRASAALTLTTQTKDSSSNRVEIELMDEGDNKSEEELKGESMIAAREYEDALNFALPGMWLSSDNVQQLLDLSVSHTRSLFRRNGNIPRHFSPSEMWLWDTDLMNRVIPENIDRNSDAFRDELPNSVKIVADFLSRKERGELLGRFNRDTNSNWFAPWNIGGNHWVAVYIQWSTRTVYVFDSILPAQDKAIIAEKAAMFEESMFFLCAVLSWFEKSYGYWGKTPESTVEWTFVLDDHGPKSLTVQQRDGSSCGLLLVYTFRLLLGLDRLVWSKNNDDFTGYYGREMRQLGLQESIKKWHPKIKNRYEEPVVLSIVPSVLSLNDGIRLEGNGGGPTNPVVSIERRTVNEIDRDWGAEIFKFSQINATVKKDLYVGKDPDVEIVQELCLACVKIGLSDGYTLTDYHRDVKYSRETLDEEGKLVVFCRNQRCTYIEYRSKLQNHNQQTSIQGKSSKRHTAVSPPPQQEESKEWTCVACEKKTSRTLWCDEHLKLRMGLQIRRSIIPNAGLGLFVTSTIPAGMELDEYEGEIVRVDDGTYSPSPYDLSLGPANSPYAVRADKPYHSAARYANTLTITDIANGKRFNAIFTSGSLNTETGVFTRPKLKTIAPIQAGHEVLVPLAGRYVTK